MTDDERVLLEHRWAVRVNPPTDAAHAACTARWALDHAAYARLELPGQEAVAQAVETLEGWAVAVDQRVKADRARRVLSSMDDARFSRSWSAASGSSATPRPPVTRPGALCPLGRGADQFVTDQQAAEGRPVGAGRPVAGGCPGGVEGRPDGAHRGRDQILG